MLTIYDDHITPTKPMKDDYDGNDGRCMVTIHDDHITPTKPMKDDQTIMMVMTDVALRRR